jgi:rubrerythrin
MALNQFGAILSFAIKLEADLQDYYQKAGNAERSRDAEKRKSKLQRARQELVLEITLEPITGLDEANYVLKVEDTSAEGQAAVERTAARFYADVAPKINVPQARRVLERCGQEHAALVG